MGLDSTQLANVLDVLPMPVLLLDAQGAIHYANRQAVSTFGYAPGEMLRMSLGHLMPPSRRAARLLAWKSFAKAPYTTTVGRAQQAFMLARNGERLPVEIHLSPIVQPSGAVWIIGVFDLLDRAAIRPEPRAPRAGTAGRDAPFTLPQPATQQEQTGQWAAEPNISGLVHLVSHPIICIQRDGVIRIWNAAAEDLFGYREDEALGRPITILWPQDPAGEIPQQLAQSLTGNTVVVPETVRVTKDGTRITVSAVYLPFFEASGAIGSVAVIFQDLSISRRQQIDQRQYIAKVAHEMKSPLATIKSIISGLRDSEIPRSAADQAQYLVEIEEETDRLANLIRNFLDLTSLESGGFRLYLEACHLQDIVDSRRRTLDVFTKQHCFRLAIAPDLPPIWADFDQVGRMLINLVANAAAYSPAGSMITLSASHGGPGASAIVSVADQGIGISDEEGVRIFQPFVRGSSSVQSGKTGYGIGLSLVKAIAEAHGGQVWFERRQTGGTIFSVSIPVAEPESPSS